MLPTSSCKQATLVYLYLDYKKVLNLNQSSVYNICNELSVTNHFAFLLNLTKTKTLQYVCHSTKWGAIDHWSSLIIIYIENKFMSKPLKATNAIFLMRLNLRCPTIPCPHSVPSARGMCWVRQPLWSPSALVHQRRLQGFWKGRNSDAWEVFNSASKTYTICQNHMVLKVI